MEISGCFLMFLIIVLANAGGLAGAGSNVPLMLYFFNLTMSQTVPLSSLMAVVSKLFRYIIHFNHKHPNNQSKNLIDYEIVYITMPFMLLGTYYGVIIGNLIGEIP